MKIFGRTQPLSRYPIQQCLEVIKRLGFDGVEICLENKDLAPASLTDEVVEAVRAKVADLRLQPYSISFHQDYIYNDTLFELSKRAIRLTRDFGADVFVFSGCRKKTGDRAEWDRMVERTRALVEVAAEHGVVLAQEPEPLFVVASTDDLMRLFDEIPSPYLAANLDLGHVFLSDPDPIASIRRVGSKIVHIHIENMRHGVHDHLLPHEGDMDLAAYLRTLTEVGYQGGLALDLYKYDYEGVAGKCIAYLRDLIAKAV